MHTLFVFQSPCTHFSYRSATAYNVTWLPIECQWLRCIVDTEWLREFKLLSTAYQRARRYPPICWRNSTFRRTTNIRSEIVIEPTLSTQPLFGWQFLLRVCGSVRYIIIVHRVFAYAQNEHFTILQWCEKCRDDVGNTWIAYPLTHGHFASNALYTLQNVDLCVCATANTHIMRTYKQYHCYSIAMRKWIAAKILGACFSVDLNLGQRIFAHSLHTFIRSSVYFIRFSLTLLFLPYALCVLCVCVCPSVVHAHAFVKSQRLCLDAIAYAASGRAVFSSFLFLFFFCSFFFSSICSLHFTTYGCY